MATDLDALQAEVLRLPAVDRAKLLDRILASLDADPDVEAEWDAIADRRELEMTSGAVDAVPIDVAIARLEARFPG